MEIIGRLSLLCETVKGTSKSTGNPYVVKEFVLEHEDEDGHKDTIYIKTMNKEHVATLDTCREGDIVKVNIGSNSQAVRHKRQDGSGFWFKRDNEIYLRSLEVVQLTSF